MEKKEILDTSVVIKEKEGVITIFSLIEFPPSSKKNFEIIFPDMEDYAKATDIASELRKRGRLIGAVDILIAAMCLNREAKLITKDQDFEFVKGIYPEFEFKLEN